MNESPLAFLPLKRRIGPILTLMFLAPLIAEVLPGATRLSSIFVFPLEFCIWGGGAVLIRAAVRHWRLGWLNLLLLAFVLAIAEEFLIQQTSLAPLVIQIFPGDAYARAFGVNYVYFLWALFYEAVFVVLVPVALSELLFRDRREDPWLRRPSALVVGASFLVACLPAWYLWTHIARTLVFKVPAYNAPTVALAIAVSVEVILLVIAIGPGRSSLLVTNKPLAPWPPWLLGLAGIIAASAWYFILLLAFRARAMVPPYVPMAGGIVLATLGIALLPKFAAHPAWNDSHRMGLVFGTIAGSMAITFIGFLYNPLPLDLYGKIVLNLLAFACLVRLSLQLRPAARTLR